MNSDEMKQIVDWISTLEVKELDFMDQMIYMQAMGEMLEKVKPLAMKYMSKDVKSSFLFKLD